MLVTEMDGASDAPHRSRVRREGAWRPRSGGSQGFCPERIEGRVKDLEVRRRRVHRAPDFGQLSGSLRLSAPTGEIIKMGSVGQDTPFLPFVGETLWNRLSQLPLPPFACRFAQPPLHNRTLRASRMHTSSFTRDREIYAIKHGAGGASAKRISATADLDAAEISS